VSVSLRPLFYSVVLLAVVLTGHLNTVQNLIVIVGLGFMFAVDIIGFFIRRYLQKVVAQQ
jgi:hypothetical protein